MKKIAFRVSEEFQNHAALIFIQNYLNSCHLKFQIFKIDQQIEFEDFQAYVASVNLTDVKYLQTDIAHFHTASKPIVVFSESSKQIAKQLQKMNPVIAIISGDPEIPYLNKIGIETENCPVNDFITDRYTKILSSPIKLSDANFDISMQNGISNLCKELVEMC